MQRQAANSAVIAQLQRKKFELGKSKSASRLEVFARINGERPKHEAVSSHEESANIELIETPCLDERKGKRKGEERGLVEVETGSVRWRVEVRVRLRVRVRSTSGWGFEALLSLDFLAFPNFKAMPGYDQCIRAIDEGLESLFDRRGLLMF